MIAPRQVQRRGRRFRRFLRRENGTALVEFGISLPTILIILFGIIETSRMLYAYQAAIGGVRDAARYFGRAIPADLCEAPDPGVAWDDWKADTDFDNKTFAVFVFDKVNEELGRGVFPGAATLLDPVVVSFACITLTKPTGVVEVTANVRIDFPFGSVFALFGEALGGFTATIADTSRVLGS